MADELDDLAGVEAFAPRNPGDPDDPFTKAFGEDRRAAAPAGGGGALAGGGLVIAVVVLVFGIVSVLLGIPDDGGDDEDVASNDVAASLDQTTSTTADRTSSTTSTTAAGTTSTTAGFTVGTGTTATTAGRTTITTVRSTTTLPEATTTTELVNRDLEIDIALSIAEPAVNQPVEITVTMSDPDAVPTGNCQVIKVDGVALFPNDPCEDQCDVDGAGAEPVGGSRTITVGHVFESEGPHEIEVSGRSGDPECNNPYASEATVTRNVTVGPAS